MPAKDPEIFARHGCPAFLADDGVLRKKFKELVKDTSIKAYVVISGQWSSNYTVEIMASNKPRTTHNSDAFLERTDFSRSTSYLKYNVPDREGYAQIIYKVLANNNINVHLNYDQGRDHWCYDLMHHLDTQHNIPVIQLSLPRGGNSKLIFKLSYLISKLRPLGICLIDNGDLTDDLDIGGHIVNKGNMINMR